MLQRLTISSLCALTVALPYGPGLAQQKAQLDCPQCGVWQVFESKIEPLVGTFVVVDLDSVQFLGCGTLSYKDPTIKALPQAKRDIHPNYDISMSFYGGTESPDRSICAGVESYSLGENAFRLEMHIDSFKQEAVRADFRFFTGQSSQPSLAFSAWNNLRASPCDGGSPAEQSDCVVQELPHLRMVILVRASAEANAAIGLQSANRKSFNATLFFSSADAVCERRSTTKGEWKASCLHDAYAAKALELQNWQTCLSTHTSPGTCLLPKASVFK
jgi:hypothetical protein